MSGCSLDEEGGDDESDLVVVEAREPFGRLEDFLGVLEPPRRGGHGRSAVSVLWRRRAGGHARYPQKEERHSDSLQLEPADPDCHLIDKRRMGNNALNVDADAGARAAAQDESVAGV